MGSLLSSAIKMQNGGAAATATLILQLVDATSMNWTKNGVSQGSITGTQTFTLNAGDTFFVTSTDTLGSSLEYYLNTAFVTSYFGIPTATSATFTASAGNEYKFLGLSGA
jgi:hypothetical protein